MMTIYFITGNKGKFSEVKEKMRCLNVSLKQENFGYPEIQASTLEEVAGYGANHIRKRFNSPFIIEDAGLFIDVLEGFPGVYSKYGFLTIGCKGILKLMEGKKRRTATFKSVYVFSEPTKKPMFFIGECPGTIAPIEKGQGGFGYDPIFIPKGKYETFAEMSIMEKNKYSHRGKALDNLIQFFIEKKGLEKQ